MARGKKVDIQPAPAAPVQQMQQMAAAPVAPVAPVAPAPGPVVAAGQQNIVIDRDNFITVRNSVYTRLKTIQELMESFSHDYLRQTNLLLGEGTDLNAMNELGGHAAHEPAAGLAAQLQMPQQQVFMPVIAAPEDGEKKRKKRQADPNAPKRPLTPFFLYMQTARPIISSDLGPETAKGAVQEEGQRRWKEMGDVEKAGWNSAYQYNLRLYNARVHAYKSGHNPDARNMSDDEALRYAEAHAHEMVSASDDAGHNELLEPNKNFPIAVAGFQMPEPDTEEEPPQEAETKTPKPKRGASKRKTMTPAQEIAAPVPAAVPAPSPEVSKKRGRPGKSADAAADTPKQKGRNKKAKTG